MRRWQDLLVVVADWVESVQWLSWLLNTLPGKLTDCSKRFPFNVPEWFDLKHQLYRLKWFWQRGRRGWSDRDIWGLDDHIIKVLAGGIARLRATKTGIPSSLIEDDADYADEAAWEAAKVKWDSILDEMIEGFGPAYQHTIDTPCWDDTKPGSRSQQSECWQSGCEAYHLKVDRAFQLLAEHHRSLWD